MNYKNSKTTKKNKITSNPVVVVCSLVILVLLFLLLLETTGVINIYTKDGQGPSSTQPIANDPVSDTYGPVTGSELSPGNAQKEVVIQSENKILPNNANVVIVDANQYGEEIEVRAFISNVIEDGECQITFTKDSGRLEKSVLARSDASTTPCVTLVFNKSELPQTGTWNVLVEYTGQSISGTAQTTMEVK